MFLTCRKSKPKKRLTVNRVIILTLLVEGEITWFIEQSGEHIQTRN